MRALFHLMQFTDSTFPVGTFSFSNGLETAANLGLVHDAETLESYVRSVMTQAAFSDGVAAMIARRAAIAQDFAAICQADQALILFKMNDEARLMLLRMGKKLAELGLRLFGGQSLFAPWLENIEKGKTPGSYPIAQGIAFALAGLGEKELFTAHQYGVINMVLSAALRCVRVSHYDTQQILFRLGEEMENMYAKAAPMNLENMNSFVPQMDIFASMHEKGQVRLFMN